MFLWAYLSVGFSAILLWFITIRVTRNEEGSDWWDCAMWVAGAYVVGFVVRGLTYVVHLPEPIGLVLQIIVGLAVLDWFLRGQYGKEKAFEIVAIFLGVRILFALPWVIMWYVSINNM